MLVRVGSDECGDDPTSALMLEETSSRPQLDRPPVNSTEVAGSLTDRAQNNNNNNHTVISVDSRTKNRRSRLFSVMTVVMVSELFVIMWLVMDKYASTPGIPSGSPPDFPGGSMAPEFNQPGDWPPQVHKDGEMLFNESVDPHQSDKMTLSYILQAQEPRCFSMCESRDIFVRSDKLIKTVVTYSPEGNKIQPVRYYMFMFPDPPLFTEEEVGNPLFLTPMLERGQIKEAREKAQVVGIPELLSTESYSGFITVNWTSNANIFFWFFPAQNGNKSAPTILWLQGGPGATGLYGLLKENGPFLADLDEHGIPWILPNPYAWTKNYSVIYVDNPVGTGFSFTDDIDDLPPYLEQSTEDLYEFLRQFFLLFPELRRNPFYAFGESYGGKYAPGIAWKIHEENEKIAKEEDRINLVGVGVGNGWMSPAEQGRYASYLFYHGLMDKLQFEELNSIDNKIIDVIEKEDWYMAWQLSDEQLNYVLTALNFSNLYDMSKDQYRPSTMNFWHWVEQKHVRSALHVGTRNFSDGLEIYMSMVNDTMRSIKPMIVNLLRNYKMLAYNGALDIICHYPGVEQMFRNADWPGREEFLSNNRRAWWAYNEVTNHHDLAGYVKTGGNLTLALIRNAGHSVPLNQPQWALRLVEDFLNGSL